MNDATSSAIKQRISFLCSDLQELMQDYLANNEESGYRYYLLMMALDELNGNEDPTCTYQEIFAEEYTDRDLDMVNKKEVILYNRKTIESYIRFNNERGWQ
jgi:hypothetical protein